MNKFKATTGQYLLRALFFETALDKSQVLYTLKREDHLGYLSLYRLYMEANDPTEYSFAVANLDGWEHWTILRECTWFKPELESWRKELEIKLRSEALRRVRELSSNPDSKEYHQANKYLLSGGWKEPSHTKRGRPSKDEIKKAANDIATQRQDLEDDYARVKALQ